LPSFRVAPLEPEEANAEVEIDLDQDVDIDQDFDKHEENSTETVAGGKQELENNVELGAKSEEHVNADVEAGALVDPFTAVGSNSDEDGGEQVNNNSDLTVEQPSEVDLQCQDGVYGGLDKSLDLEDDSGRISLVNQAFVKETELNVNVGLELDEDIDSVGTRSAVEEAGSAASNKVMLGESDIADSWSNDGRGA